ncbi:MAG: AAA family ATPase [Vicinamibacterales bacterium]
MTGATFTTSPTRTSLPRCRCRRGANGGYLIVDARRVLMEPFAWDGLKRALRSSLIHIESIAARSLRTAGARLPHRRRQTVIPGCAASRNGGPVAGVACARPPGVQGIVGPRGS